MLLKSPGRDFKYALEQEKPLQLVGVVNACTALLASQQGFHALYLSGAGVANACFGLPDLGLTSLETVLEETRRITGCVELPLIVDADTGWGTVLNIQRTVREFIRAQAAGIHIEDQDWPKRCGHLEGKQLVTSLDMVARIKAAVDARFDPNFMIIARTDAVSVEGLEAAIARAVAYVEAGADVIFAESCTTLAQYQKFVTSLSVPVLANITEFGKTPLFSLQELQQVGIGIVLYPLSAFRAMNKIAEHVYRTIKIQGTQKELLSQMQTRHELYDLINYDAYAGLLK